VVERNATTTSVLRVEACERADMKTMRTLRVACVLMLLVATSGITTSWAQATPKCLGKTATVVAQADEPHDIIGTQGNDVIVAGPRDDRIDGRAGNDTICGAGGSDTIAGGPGDDDIDGGTHQAGGDFASYLEAPEGTDGKGVTVDLEGLGGFHATGDGDDTLVNVENVIGSFFADTIRGDSNDNVLLAGGGDDVLFGRDGSDDVEGFSGDDVLSPGNGTDKVLGHEGSDTISFRGALDSVVVNLASKRRREAGAPRP
jgi:Ca2+-binding RTX toxin-like protein